MLNKSMENCLRPKICHCGECQEDRQIQNEMDHFFGERD